jgi:hypothetical protein
MDAKATSHLIYTSVKSGSSRGKAFPENSRHIVHNGRPTCGSLAAKQTVFQSSNVGDTVAGDAGSRIFSVHAVWGDQFNSVSTKLAIQFVGVIGIVAY